MVNSKMIPFTNGRRSVVPESYMKSQHDNVKWMISFAFSKKAFAFSKEAQPMWVGWNAKKEGDTFRKTQKIFYLPQINQSPTLTAFVAETLKRALKFATHFKKESVAVTYHLAIANIAMQIQATKTPTYDKVFVALGAFHIELFFFSASGKYIAESGGPYIRNKAKVIEKGSLNRFIMSTNYDHCKRSHQPLALAFETLLFKSFLSTDNTDYDEVIADITENVDENNESSIVGRIRTSVIKIFSKQVFSATFAMDVFLTRCSL